MLILQENQNIHHRLRVNFIGACIIRSMHCTKYVMPLVRLFLPLLGRFSIRPYTMEHEKLVFSLAPCFLSQCTGKCGRQGWERDEHGGHDRLQRGRRWRFNVLASPFCSQGRHRETGGGQHSTLMAGYFAFKAKRGLNSKRLTMPSPEEERVKERERGNVQQYGGEGGKNGREGEEGEEGEGDGGKGRGEGKENAGVKKVGAGAEREWVETVEKVEKEGEERECGGGGAGRNYPDLRASRRTYTIARARPL